MTDLRKAAEMALAALEDANTVIEHKQDVRFREQAIEALRTALAQTEQEYNAGGEPVRNASYWKRQYDKLKAAQPEQEHFCDTHCVHTDHHPDCELARPEQEPVAWLWLSKGKPVNALMRKPNVDHVYFVEKGFSFKPLYTAPPKREWQELTDEDWHNLPTSNKQGCERDAEIFNWIEDKLKEKNT